MLPIIRLPLPILKAADTHYLPLTDTHIKHLNFPLHIITDANVSRKIVKVVFV
jgi:hypothetical protein